MTFGPVLTAVLALLGSDRLEVRPAPVSELMEELAQAPTANLDREAALIALFRQAGAAEDEVELQPVPADPDRRLRGVRFELRRMGVGPVDQAAILKREAERYAQPGNNVIVRIAGQTDRLLVFGAHLDAARGSAGVVSNWTGCVALANLYQALRDSRPQHTLVFVGFAAQNLGCLGSSTYAESLGGDELARLDAMINFECLGTAPPAGWADGSSVGPRYAAERAAEALGIELMFRVFENLEGNDSDVLPFRKRKVPTLFLDGMRPELAGSLRAGGDTPDAVRAEWFEQAYGLLQEVVQQLDPTLEPLTRNYLRDQLELDIDQLDALQSAVSVRLGSADARRRGSAPADAVKPEEGSSADEASRAKTGDGGSPEFPSPAPLP